AAAVVTDATGRPVDSQLVDLDGDETPDQLVWQADFAAGETKAFTVQAGARRPGAGGAYQGCGRVVCVRRPGFGRGGARTARLVFELGYAAWEAGGARVAETKRVVLDAGARFDRFESTFRVDGRPAGARAPLAVAVGIARHEGGVAAHDVAGGWLRTWEPLKE